MSHLQNEYLIQTVAKSLLDEELFVASVPLALVVECLPELFFHQNSRLGQLVLPSLGQNFGPRYVCKLQINGTFAWQGAIPIPDSISEDLDKSGIN